MAVQGVPSGLYEGEPFVLKSHLLNVYLSKGGPQ